MNPTLADCAPPRLLRALAIEALLLTAAALLSDLPTRSPGPARQSPPKPPPRPVERRLRVLRLPPPPPPQLASLPTPRPPPLSAQPPSPASAQPPPPAAARPPPASPPSAHPPLARAVAQPTPPAPTISSTQNASPEPSPTPAPPLAPAEIPTPVREMQQPVRIAAEAREVHGVRLRVLIPRDPADLAAHLRGSGGCLVVSRLDGAGAEVLSVLGLDASSAVEVPGPPCAGVPRLIDDASLNQALGDPLGRARTTHPGERLALQVILSPELPQLAQEALRARFGEIPPEEMARKAAEAGYELTCFAEPKGPVRCE